MEDRGKIFKIGLSLAAHFVVARLRYSTVYNSIHLTPFLVGA